MKDRDLARLFKDSSLDDYKVSSSFTSNVMGRITQDRPSHTILRRIIIMFRYNKTTFAALALLIAVGLGGTTYAAVSTITAHFAGEKKLTTSRIVKVSATDCQITSGFNITNKGSRTEPFYYYSVKDGSTLTNEQVVQMVRGECENVPAYDISAALSKNPLNTNTTVANAVLTVAAVTPTSLTLHGTYGVGLTSKETVNQNFTHVDPNVIVYKGAQLLSWQDIKPGDMVYTWYRASGDALTHSETMDPNNPLIAQQTIVGVGILTPDEAAAVNFGSRYNEIQQVVPCAQSSGNYCDASGQIVH